MVMRLGVNGYRRNEILLLSALYIFGFVHWVGFFAFAVPEGGDHQLAGALFSGSFQWFKLPNFTVNDWHHDLSYVGLIKQGVRELQIPFHAPDLYKMYPIATRYLGGTVYSSSPQIILLRWLEPVSFALVNHLLLYTIGFYGCLLFRKTYQLGAMPFIFLFLIFNFQGGFVEKVSAYGIWQAGYYFLPFIVLILLQAKNLQTTDVRGQVRHAIWLGLAIAAMGHQGTMNLYVHVVTFVSLWGIANYRLWKFSVGTVFVAFSATFFRLLLMTLTFGSDHNARYDAWGGYSTFEQLIESLVLIHIITDVPAWAWWEFSLYVSIFGFLLLVYFSLWSPLVGYSWTKFNGWKALIFPFGILSFAAIRHFKHWVLPHWLPFYNGEDVTMRYVVTLLVILTFIASINFQGFCEKYIDRRRVKFVLVLLLAGLSISFLEHSRKWRMNQVQAHHEAWLEEDADEVLQNGMTLSAFYEEHEKLALKIENDPEDVVYISFFWIGLVGTLFSLAFYTWWLWKDPLKGHAQYDGSIQ